MEKNTAGKWTVFAFGAPSHATLAGLPVTGDALNITATVYIDGVSNAVDDTNPTELGTTGYYVFDLTAAETNGDNLSLVPVSSTTNVEVVAIPGVVYTRPANFNDQSITATTGRVDVAAIAGTAQTANDNGADINAILTDTADMQPRVAAIETDTSTTLQAELDAIQAAVITNAAGVDIAADIIAVKAQTAAIEIDTAEIGTAGAGLTEAGGTGDQFTGIAAVGDVTNLSNLPAIPANWITAAGINTGALNGKGDWNINKTGYSISGTITTLDGLNDLSAAEVNAQVDTALTDIHLDHLFAVDYDPATPPGTATAWANELVESDVGVTRFTVNALENAPSGTGASAEVIADAVWDEAQSGHTTAGTFGKFLDTEVSGVGDATAANQTTIINHLTDVKGITWDSTNSLEAIHDDQNITSSNVSTILGTVNSVQTVTDLIATDTSDIKGTGFVKDTHSLTDILEDTSTTIPAALTIIDDFLDTEVQAILDAVTSTGAVLTAAERNAIADAILDRNMATGTDSGSATVRTPRQALRFLRNKWDVAGTTLTVNKEDDSTASWTAVVSTDATADPVTGSNPAGGA